MLNCRGNGRSAAEKLYPGVFRQIGPGGSFCAAEWSGGGADRQDPVEKFAGQGGGPGDPAAIAGGVACCVGRKVRRTGWRTADPSLDPGYGGRPFGDLYAQ